MDEAIAYLRKKGVATAAKKADRQAAEGLVGVVQSGDKKSAAAVEVNSETDFVARNKDFMQLVATVANTSLAMGSESDYLDTEDVEGFLGASVQGGDGTVQGLITDAIGSIKENMKLRRVLNVRSPSLVSTYMHSSVGNVDGVQLGRIASVVSFASADGSAITPEQEVFGNKLAMHVVAANPQYLTKEDVPEEVLEKEKAIFRDQAKETGKPDHIVEKMMAGRINKFMEEIVLLEQMFVIIEDDSKPEKVKALLKKQGLQVNNFRKYGVGEGIMKADSSESFADEVSRLAGQQ